MNAVTMHCQGWRFQADREKTEAFQSKLQAEALTFPAELQALFEGLGIDPARPLMKTGNSLCYIFFGAAESKDGFELDFYTPEQFVSVVIYPYPQGYREDGLSIQEPCILLEVFGAKPRPKLIEKIGDVTDYTRESVV